MSWSIEDELAVLLAGDTEVFWYSRNRVRLLANLSCPDKILHLLVSVLSVLNCFPLICK